MSFSVGLVGLPNAGKSTLFKALTRKKVDIASYPFTTINPNIGIVTVPDENLEKIAQVIEPEKVTPTIIEFIDIAGLVKGAHKGEGLGNQFLGHIRNCEAILEIVRAFKDINIEHIEGEVNPERDVDIIKTEFLMKDLEVLEGLISKLTKDIKAKEKKAIKKLELLNRIKENIAKGEKISEMSLTDEEKAEIKEFRFLTEKPVIYVLNINNHQSINLKNLVVTLNLKLEEEISELSESEIKEIKVKPELDRLILACYNILDLITFYTVAGNKESRAWTLKKGATCPKAGGVVHSDFEEKFIRAEVVSWKTLFESASWKKAQEKGLIKNVGKEYIVRDGDVIEFKI